MCRNSERSFHSRLIRRLGAYTEWLAKQAGWCEGRSVWRPRAFAGGLFRAVRLVVDTGIHAKRWTREQAIAYMREKTGMGRKR